MQELQTYAEVRDALWGFMHSSSRQSGQAQPSVYEDYNAPKLYLKTYQALWLIGHSYLKDIILPLICVMAPSPLQVLIFLFFPFSLLTRFLRFRSFSQPLSCYFLLQVRNEVKFHNLVQSSLISKITLLTIHIILKSLQIQGFLVSFLMQKNAAFISQRENLSEMFDLSLPIAEFHLINVRQINKNKNKAIE